LLRVFLRGLKNILVNMLTSHSMVSKASM